jgi:hypothetical protein
VPGPLALLATCCYSLALLIDLPHVVVIFVMPVYGTLRVAGPLACLLLHLLYAWTYFAHTVVSAMQLPIGFRIALHTMHYGAHFPIMLTLSLPVVRGCSA